MNQSAQREEQSRRSAPAVTEPARPRRRWIWLLALVLIAGGSIGFVMWRRERGRAAANAIPPPRATPVVAAVARQDDLPVYFNALGTAVPLNTVTVRTRVDGELVNVAFTEGSLVHQGDLLAEIDPRPFQVLLEQAQGQLARDRALLDNARRDLERYQQAREAIPQQQVDTAAATVAQYEAAVLVDQAQIDSAQLQLTYSRIISPITGKIGLRLVDRGNIVHAGDANGLAVITQLQPISVQCSLPQDNLPQLFKAAARGPVPAQAFDRDFSHRLEVGQMAAVDSQIDPTTATVRLRAEFENQDGALFPNQFVNVRLLVDTLRSVVLVPAAAVQRSPTSMFVYVVKDDQSVEVRPVTVGPTEADTTAITKGVAAGEIVVTDGVDKLQQGAKVVARLPGANGATGETGARPVPPSAPSPAASNPAGTNAPPTEGAGAGGRNHRPASNTPGPRGGS